MTDQVIVLIADRDDPRHGEIALCDTAADAERLIETLLEAGFDQERLRVFAGMEMDAQVSQRPAVTLVEMQPDQPEATDETPSDDPPAYEEVQAQDVPSDVPARAEGSRDGSAPLLAALPARPVEMMPELHH